MTNLSYAELYSKLAPFRDRLRAIEASRIEEDGAGWIVVLAAVCEAGDRAVERHELISLCGDKGGPRRFGVDEPGSATKQVTFYGRYLADRFNVPFLFN